MKLKLHLLSPSHRSSSAPGCTLALDVIPWSCDFVKYVDRCSFSQYAHLPPNFISFRVQRSWMCLCTYELLWLVLPALHMGVGGGQAGGPEGQLGLSCSSWVLLCWRGRCRLMQPPARVPRRQQQVSRPPGARVLLAQRADVCDA